MFTSNRGLIRIDSNPIADVVGRIEVTTQLCGDGDGQFRPEKLALRLSRLDQLHLDQK